jgi:hypothetical protein
MSAQPEETQFRPEGPQPLLREIAPGMAYPVQALGPLRAAVEAVQGMTQAPVAIPAQSALAVASLAVMAFANVETLGGNRPLSLYALTIAQSGERKSSCDAPLMAALRAHEREQAVQQRAAVQSWQNAHALWKGERDRILTGAKGKGDNRTAAQADLERLGGEPSAPPSTDRTVTEPTFEGLTRLFVTGQPALGLFSDEGGQFLGGFAMNSENRQKTLAALNDLWQGSAIRRTRAGEGAITLFGRRLAVHLMVQPGVARAFMADPMAGETGFLPRFLMCEPTSAIGHRPHALARADDAGALAAFGARLRDILETPQPMDPDTRELTPRLLPLSGQAKAHLIDFADAIEAAQAPGGDLSHVTGYASKAAEQACRIAGVLTLWRDLYAPEVTGADMADAIDLAQFYLAEAARLSDGAKVSAEIERAEALRKWLVERWPEPEILLRDVMHDCPIRALRESPKARAAINLLVQHGWLVPLPPGSTVRGAARKEAWRIVRPGHAV